MTALGTLAHSHECWDTMIASRLLTSRSHDALQAFDANGVIISVSPPTIREIAFGAAQIADPTPVMRSLMRPIRQGLIHLLPLTTAAAWLAGQLDATVPLPPAKRGDQRSKARRRESFSADILIAATAYVAHASVRTANETDFQAIQIGIDKIVDSRPLTLIVDKSQTMPTP